MVINNFNYYGGSQVIVNLAKAFLSEGHEVDIIAIRSTKVDLTSRPKTQAKVTDLLAANFFKGVIELGREIRREDYDICYSVGLYANLVAGLTGTLRSYTTKFIGSEHFATSPLLSNFAKPYFRLILPLIKIAYRRLNGLIFVSVALKEAFIENNGFNPSRCVSIYNPLPDNSRYKRKTKPSNKKVILGLGILEERKRWDLLIEAFALLNKELDCILLIGGTGSLEKSLHDLTENLKLKKKVKFLGYVAEPQNFLVQSDVLALTSDSEAFGMVLAEAMSVGTQVVSTDVFSGPKEVLGYGKYGFLAKKGDVTSIVSALRQACIHPKEKKLLAEAVQRFEPGAIAQQYIDFFEKISASKGTINDKI